MASAQGPSRHYFYRLEATRPIEGSGVNSFKLRSSGYLSTGRADLVDASFGIIATLANYNDVGIVYPDFNGNINNPGVSNYTGDWQFYFYVPNDTETLTLWDGDFDRGTTQTQAQDDDDPNTVGKPEWAGPSAVEERAGGKGAPPDNHWHPVFSREPAVQYELVDPVGDPVYTNMEPSGTEEWERFVMSTNSDVDADIQVNEIKAGFFTLHIQGLDMHNFVAIRVDQQICDQEDGCGPPEWPEGSCPRTIGYWKNNVKKVLIDGRTRGVQESRETLEQALDMVALASPLYRNGINVADPAVINTVARLTDDEANMILQRSKKDYPGDSQSMLARALQQNLATWLNLGSGKIGPTTVVELNVHGGLFEGTVWEALQEAQDIILNGGDLERAKDIGDQINNGLLGEDAADSVCSDYEQTIPPDKQPPDYEDMPEAPVEPEPPNPTPVPAPDPETCAGVRVNQYNVENPTNNPFEGIKFEYQSGAEIKNSDLDEFKVVLTEEQAAALTSVQMEAKAANDVGMVTLEACQFDQPLPCGEPVRDDDLFFAFYFMGAEDNGDGTLTLTFMVQNFTEHGLSHVTIGVVPSAPTGSYQSEVCP